MLAEATAGWPRPTTPHVASTSVGSTSNDITINRTWRTESCRPHPRARAIGRGPGSGWGDVEYMRALSCSGGTALQRPGNLSPRRLSNPPCPTQPGLLTVIIRAIAENGFKVRCELAKSSVPSRARRRATSTRTLGSLLLFRPPQRTVDLAASVLKWRLQPFPPAMLGGARTSGGLDPGASQ